MANQRTNLTYELRIDLVRCGLLPDEDEAARAQAAEDLAVEDQGTLVVDHQTGDRLKAARVAAGYVVAKSAIDILGIAEPTYRHAETGFRSAGSPVLDAAAALYEVSTHFLVTGEARSEREHFVSRLAQAIAGSREPSDGSWSSRLRRVRIESGHATAIAAAKQHGWPISTYNAHELGTRMMSIERLIGYCLAMGARPEFGASGSMPVMDLRPAEWSEVTSVVGTAPDSAPTP